MAGEPAYPTVPETALDGWTLTDESVETLFQLPAARVRGATRRYEDRALREAVREATGGELDHEVRFFAATRLGFTPSLPPGTMPSLILPTVRSEAETTFRRRLRDRGVEDLDRAARERMRVRSGSRARLTRYDGVDPTVGDGLAVSGWVGVWKHRRDLFVVTGGYPAVRVADVLDVEDAGDPLAMTPSTYRDELLDAFREVG
jgi:hypothetical protein